MGDPDDPDLVVVRGDGILGNKRTVPYNHDFNRVETEVPEEGLDQCRAGFKHADGLVRQDDLHAVPGTGEGEGIKEGFEGSYCHKHAWMGSCRDRNTDMKCRIMQKQL